MANMDHEVFSDGRTVWVNDCDGMSLGRFSRFGIDVHKTLDEQMNGGGQCLDCSHGTPTIAEWERFCQNMKEHHGIEVEEHHRPDFLHKHHV